MRGRGKNIIREASPLFDSPLIFTSLKKKGVRGSSRRVHPERDRFLNDPNFDISSQSW